jgi:hypothetical protein
LLCSNLSPYTVDINLKPPYIDSSILLRDDL